MKSLLFAVLVLSLFTACAFAQSATAPPSKAPVAVDAQRGDHRDDIQELRSDVQRLQILVNQMRNNLAFVQSSQTPLKHQFELEADAWQVVINGMNRRIQRMEERSNHDQHQQDHR